LRGRVTTAITLQLAGGAKIVSTITSSSTPSLNLAEGANAFDIILVFERHAVQIRGL
jgi:molybdopterin-binding protein